MQVHFFECAGEDALGKLETLKQRLKLLPNIHSLKLLKNTKQPDLYLLVVEASEVAHIDVPDGTRVWSFEEVRMSNAKELGNGNWDRVQPPKS